MKVLRSRLPFQAFVCFLLSCTGIPSADVRHSHVEIDLVDGATVVPAGPSDAWYEREIGYSHIAKGDRVVLLARDSDADLRYTDTGSAEFLLVDLPALREGAVWEIGKETWVWFWRGSAWGNWAVRELRGTVFVERRPRNSWAVNVNLSGLRVEVAGGLGTTPEDIRLVHSFVAARMPYDEFRRRYPPVTSWTR